MLTEYITQNDIKKIFGNKNNKQTYLRLYFEQQRIDTPISRDNLELDQQIIDTWSYDESKTIIREMFRNHSKYAEQQNAAIRLNEALEEWRSLNIGAFEWPFSAMAFDQHVHMLNRRTDCSEAEKDEIISNQAIKFRRIKHINALRNDYIEFLIFQNENVIPTLGNRKSVDFYINGEPYDQKVGKSVGNAFKNEHGAQYREVAISRPDLLAASLYENQDEERFGDEARLLIVYLDNDIDANNIEQQLSNVDFNNPYEITFNYKHSNNQVIQHTTKCFVVLLHN